MRDNLDPRDAARPEAAPEPTSRTNPEQERVTDQEVPMAARMPEIIQRWLDGEPVSEDELRASGQNYELWRKVQAEVSRRARVKTPPPLPDQIMKAIPKK